MSIFIYKKKKITWWQWTHARMHKIAVRCPTWNTSFHFDRVSIMRMTRCFRVVFLPGSQMHFQSSALRTENYFRWCLLSIPTVAFERQLSCMQYVHLPIAFGKLQRPLWSHLYLSQHRINSLNVTIFELSCTLSQYHHIYLYCTKY